MRTRSGVSSAVASGSTSTLSSSACIRSHGSEPAFGETGGDSCCGACRDERMGGMQAGGAPCSSGSVTARDSP
jgi:hypothetical protein